LGIGPRKGVLARHCNQWGLDGVRVRQRCDAALFPNYLGQIKKTGYKFINNNNDELLQRR